MAYNSMREIKLCLLGDSGVGKSSLVLRFVLDRFDQYSTATIGASFMSKSFIVGEETYKYQIWDTAGQEKYKALAPMYYRGASAAIVVYDITNENSFESVKMWIRELQQLGPPDIVIAIAGNKTDLVDQREVPTENGIAYAEKISAVFAETSALNASNVNYLFEEISKKLPAETAKYSYGSQITVKEKEQSNKSCCE